MPPHLMLPFHNNRIKTPCELRLRRAGSRVSTVERRTRAVAQPQDSSWTQDAAYFHDVRRRATRLYHFFSLLYFVKIRKNICAADNKHTYQEIKKEPRIVAQRIGVATSLSMHHCIRVPVSGSGSSLVGRPTMTTLDSVQHTPEAGLPTPASRPWKVLSRVLGWPARIGSSMRRSAAAVAEPAPARHSRRHLPPTS